MRTPAQASGRYDFVTDVPVQGPTDEGIRAADCWWTQNVLPVANPACSDCKGPIPQWARNPAGWSGGPVQYGGRGCGSVEPVWYRGGCVAGFSLADPPPLPPAMAVPEPPPGPAAPPPSSKLSTGAMIGIGAGAAVVLSGIIYAASKRRR